MNIIKQKDETSRPEILYRKYTIRKTVTPNFFSLPEKIFDL